MTFSQGCPYATPCTLHPPYKRPNPYTLHHTPYNKTPTTQDPNSSYTLHPTPYTLHPASHTLNPTPYTLQPTPYALHPTPYTLSILHPIHYILHPTHHTLHPTPLHSTPYTLHPAPYNHPINILNPKPKPFTLHPPHTLHHNPRTPPLHRVLCRSSWSSMTARPPNPKLKTQHPKA